jgi:hypothetical protein
VPVPLGGVDTSTLMRGLRLLSFSVCGDRLLGEEGALYFPWKRVVTATPPGAWRTAEEPWVVKAPDDKGFKPLHLYGVRRAFAAHSKRAQAGAGDVSALRARYAHRLVDAAGRPHLVLLVQARLHKAEEPVEAVMVLSLPP